jgi:hypothetical protein
MTEWLLSRQAEIVAWTALLVATGNFIAAGRDLVRGVGWLFKVIRKPFGHKTELMHKPNPKGDDAPMRRRGLIIIITGLLFASLSGGIIMSRHVAAQNLPVNARLTKEAWDAYNKGDWHTAILKADECINQFQYQADDQQAQLEKRGAIVPLGTVSKPAKDEILIRGPLNDVGTAFYIKGQAMERTGKIEDAKLAYQAASKYTYARCYDSSFDGFWSPSDTAKGRLRHLKLGPE